MADRLLAELTEALRVHQDEFGYPGIPHTCSPVCARSLLALMPATTEAVAQRDTLVKALNDANYERSMRMPLSVRHDYWRHANAVIDSVFGYDEAAYRESKARAEATTEAVALAALPLHKDITIVGIEDGGDVTWHVRIDGENGRGRTIPDAIAAALAATGEGNDG